VAERDDVRRVVAGLAGATYDEDSATCLVEGTKFGWVWRERVHPTKPTVRRPDVMVVTVDGEDDKQALLAAHPDTLFTEPHYDGYAVVLVRLPTAGVELLGELLTDSHRLVLDRQRAGRGRRSRGAGRSRPASGTA
jgi:hypothetical protein